MIGDLLITIYLGFLAVAVAWLPTWPGYPQGITDGITWFYTQVYSLSCLLPLDTLFSVLRLMVVGLIGFWGFRFATWVFHWNQPGV